MIMVEACHPAKYHKSISSVAPYQFSYSTGKMRSEGGIQVQQNVR